MQGHSASAEPSGPVARSPFARRLAGRGARWGRVGAWEVALHVPGEPQGEAATPHRVWTADISCLPKRAVYGKQAAQRVAALLGIEERAELGTGAARRSADGSRLLCVLRANEAIVIDGAMDADALELGKELFAVDRTGGLASLALVGADVARVLQRLTALDATPGGFPPGRCAVGRVAEVRALLVHAADHYYQIHVERADAEHLWDALLAAGEGLGVGLVGWKVLRSLVGEGEKRR